MADPSFTTGHTDINHAFQEMGTAAHQLVGSFEFLATAVEVVAAQLLTIPTLMKDAFKTLGQGQAPALNAAKAQEIALSQQLGKTLEGVIEKHQLLEDRLQSLQDINERSIDIEVERRGELNRQMEKARAEMAEFQKKVMEAAAAGHFDAEALKELGRQVNEFESLRAQELKLDQAINEDHAGINDLNDTTRQRLSDLSDEMENTIEALVGLEGGVEVLRQVFEKLNVSTEGMEGGVGRKTPKGPGKGAGILDTIFSGILSALQKSVGQFIKLTAETTAAIFAMREFVNALNPNVVMGFDFALKSLAATIGVAFQASILSLRDGFDKLASIIFPLAGKLEGPITLMIEAIVKLGLSFANLIATIGDKLLPVILIMERSISSLSDAFQLAFDFISGLFPNQAKDNKFHPVAAGPTQITSLENIARDLAKSSFSAQPNKIVDPQQQIADGVRQLNVSLSNNRMEQIQSDMHAIATVMTRPSGFAGHNARVFAGTAAMMTFGQLLR